MFEEQISKAKDDLGKAQRGDATALQGCVAQAIF